MFSSFSGGAGYTAGKRHVLIMDEVDGMSGNEDRGGVQVWVHGKDGMGTSQEKEGV